MREPINANLIMNNLTTLISGTHRLDSLADDAIYIASNISNTLKQYFRMDLSGTASKKESLQRHVSQYKELSKIDYSIESDLFNECYFTRNLIKCISTSRIATKHFDLPTHDIYDLGCGAGTFSLAIKSVISEKQSRIFRLYDTSPQQLTLAQHLASPKNTERYFFFTEDFAFGDIIENSLVLMSYSACENLNNPNWENFFNRIQNKRVTVLICDYECVIKKVADLISALQCKKEILYIKERINSNDLQDSIGQNSFSLHGLAVKFY